MAGSEHLTTQIDQITAPLIELCDSSDNLLRIAVASRIIQTAIPFAPVQDRNKLERIAYQCDGRVKKTAGRYEVVIGDLGRWIDQYEDNSDIRFKTRLVRRVLEAALGVLPENSKLCNRLTDIVAGYPELGAKERNEPIEPAASIVVQAPEPAPNQQPEPSAVKPAPAPVLEDRVEAPMPAEQHESLHGYMKRFIAQNEGLEGQKLITRAISVTSIIKKDPKRNEFVVSEKVVRNSHHAVINPGGLEQYLKQILYAPKPEQRAGEPSSEPQETPAEPRPPSFLSIVNKVYDSEKQRGANLKNCALTYYAKLKKDPKIQMHLGVFKQGFSYLFAKNPDAVEAELLHYFREVVPAAENKPAAPEPQKPAPVRPIKTAQEPPSLISIIRKACYHETWRGAKPAHCPETYLKLMKDMHKISRHLGTVKKGRFPCLVAKNPAAVEAAVLKYFRVEAAVSRYSDEVASVLNAQREMPEKKEQSLVDLVRDVVSDELELEGRSLKARAYYLWRKFSTDAVVSKCVYRAEGEKQYVILKPKMLEHRLRILLRREKKPKKSPLDILGAIVAKPEHLSGEKLEGREKYLWHRFCSDAVVKSCVERKGSGDNKYYEFIDTRKLKQRLRELWKSLPAAQSGVSIMRKVVAFEEGLAGSRLASRAQYFWNQFNKKPDVQAYIPEGSNGRCDTVPDPYRLERCLTRHLREHKAKIAVPSLKSLLRTVISKKANITGLAKLESKVNMIMPFVKSDPEAKDYFDAQGSGAYTRYHITNPVRLEKRMSQIVDDCMTNKFRGRGSLISTYTEMVKDAVRTRVKGDKSITKEDIEDEARYLSMRFRKDGIVQRLIKKGGKNCVSIPINPEKLKERIDTLVDEYRRHVSPLCRDDVSTAIQFEVTVKPLGSKVTYKNIVRLAISRETGLLGSELENDVLRFIRKHNDDAVLNNLTVFYEMNRKSNVAKLDEYVRELVAKDYDTSDKSAENGVRAGAKDTGLYEFASGIACSLFESQNSEINYCIDSCIRQWAKRDDVKPHVKKGKVKEPAKLRPVLTDLIMREQEKLDPCAPKRSEFEGKYFSLNEIRTAIGVNDIHQFKNYIYLLGEPLSVKGHSDSPAAYKGVNTYHFVMAVRADMMRKGALKPLEKAASE